MGLMAFRLRVERVCLKGPLSEWLLTLPGRDRRLSYQSFHGIRLVDIQLMENLRRAVKERRQCELTA